MTYCVGLLNDRSICNGVREWHPKLNHVCTAGFHRQQYWDGVCLCRISSGDEGHQSRYALAQKLV